MIQARTLFYRTVSGALCFALLNFSVPYGALATLGKPAVESVRQSLAERARARKDLARRRAQSASRPLSETEQRQMKGQTGENPYLAGQSKWDVVYKGVDLLTGNYTASATDMSFEGGYGIPVNVTRSYSANDGDEGPFGKGWTLSADVRSTAGGVLKSSGAPSFSVPTSFKERPSGEADPNAETATGAATQPAVAVTATSADGQQETIQRDVDGVLTTPPWDKNNNLNTQYEFVTLGGSTYQVTTHNETLTLDGTLYVYDKHGSYPSGTVPYGSTGATPQASNVLKITKAVDRQGNETDYHYGESAYAGASSTVTFSTSNGSVTEDKLTSVQMPNGHLITFTWGDGSTGHPNNRVWKVADNGAVRVVTYGYDASGLLTSVTTPGGKTTTYGYGYAGGAGPLITSVTDPRGLTTTIGYLNGTVPAQPWNVGVTAPIAYKIAQPNGVDAYFLIGSNALPSGDNPFGPDASPCLAEILEKVGGASGTTIHFGAIATTTSGTGSDATLTVACGRLGIGETVLEPGDGTEFSPDADWRKTYAISSQNLMSESHFTYRSAAHEQVNDLGTARQMVLPSWTRQSVITSKTYNFAGNPLSQTTTEQQASDAFYSSETTTRTAETDYAYWGADKYYQQKAVRDQAGRISFTDYYDDSSATGSKGQTRYVYSPAYTTYDNATGSNWKSVIVPHDPSTYSGSFQYDGEGRATDVWKLQSTGTSPWTYVQTHTYYGSNTDGSWGAAHQVVEDYGGIGRTTTTNAYTSWGKPSSVTDAKGQTFVTSYDLDEQVQSVTRTDVSPNQSIVVYGYGSTPGTLTYGVPVSITDGLSGVTQSISYTASGGGIGQVAQTSETDSSTQTYTVAYTYSGAGDRQTATYVTPNGTSEWGYYDYIGIGDPDSPKRPFQTLVRLDPTTGYPTSEEFHYQYDSAARLVDATFAQTPKTGFTPSTGGSWYDASHLAQERARAYYSYDPAGRILSAEHYWDALSGSSYGTSQTILANECAYEVGTGLNRGLKTSSALYVPSSSGATTWSLSRTETYGYDANLDYLTSASYGDGLAGASDAWTYDAAGNRISESTRSGSFTYDNLNRMTAAPGATYTNDILGNRTNRNQWAQNMSMSWDCLNRLTDVADSDVAVPWHVYYQYRADGMRVYESIDAGTYHRYDGQMQFEDAQVQGPRAVTRYGLGARGVDFMERTAQDGTVSTYFPLYDAMATTWATFHVAALLGPSRISEATMPGGKSDKAQLQVSTRGDTARILGTSWTTTSSST